jgi:hypothetical protein
MSSKKSQKASVRKSSKRASSIVINDYKEYKVDYRLCS